MSKQVAKSAKRSVEVNGVEFTVSQTKLRNGEPILIAFRRGQRGAVHRARTEDAMMAELAALADLFARAKTAAVHLEIVDDRPHETDLWYDTSAELEDLDRSNSPEFDRDYPQPEVVR